jgi:hypothetical protein
VRKISVFAVGSVWRSNLVTHDRLDHGDASTVIWRMAHNS